MYVVLDGLRISVRARSISSSLARRRAAPSAALDSDPCGRERGLADRRRRHAYFAFPALYAATSAAFNLPLMIVLWLLMLRGIAIRFRSHVDSPAWTTRLGLVFSLSSLLLLSSTARRSGNVVRGVPLTAEAGFFARSGPIAGRPGGGIPRLVQP